MPANAGHSLGSALHAREHQPADPGFAIIGRWHVVPPPHVAPMDAAVQPSYAAGGATHVVPAHARPELHTEPEQHAWPEPPHVGVPVPGTHTIGPPATAEAQVVPVGQPPPPVQSW